MSKPVEKGDVQDLATLAEGGRTTLTITKTGTLPTLERLITEMANLEKEAAALERKKKEIVKLIEENKTLKARNYFLERENNTLKIEKATDTTRSFDFRPNFRKSSEESSSVELTVMTRRHPAHEDDKTIVKVVTSFIFAVLPTLLGVGIWAACLLNNSKLWYDTSFKSPLKVPFYVFGAVWCGIYCTMGVAIYMAWYHLGGRRGVPYLALGFVTLVISYAVAPLLLVGHWYIPTMAVVGVLWFMVVACIMSLARVSMLTGVTVLPCLMWTTFTAAMVFFPFHEKYFSKTATS